MKLFLYFSLLFFSFTSIANDRPLSVSVITGSYTVPAGRWAKVLVNLEGSASFTIGGVTALRGTQNSVVGSVSSSCNTTCSGASGWPTPGSAATDQKTTVGQFEAPSGVVLNGSGTWRAVVTLYER